jgi:hypothetical protein
VTAAVVVVVVALARAAAAARSGECEAAHFPLHKRGHDEKNSVRYQADLHFENSFHEIKHCAAERAGSGKPLQISWRAVHYGAAVAPARRRTPPIDWVF